MFRFGIVSILLTLIIKAAAFGAGAFSSEESKSEVNRDSSIYVPLKNFVYADNVRYTISGSPPLEDTKLKTTPTILFASGLTCVFIAQHIGQLQTIWKEMGDFTFTEDIEQDMWADKCGHFYGSYLASYILSESMMEVGFSWEAATVWGGVLGLSYSTYVEILDGFGENWGFSPSDFYADIAGAVFFIGQHYIPFLQNFTPRFSYIPAELYGEDSRQPSTMFIDDYSSQSFWISANVENMLPEKMKPYWADWLQISFGYAARNLCAPLVEGSDCDPNKSEVRNGNIVWGSPRYIVALDVDYVKALPDCGKFGNWLKQSLNFFKLPTPAVEFSKKGTKFYLLYPFAYTF